MYGGPQLEYDSPDRIRGPETLGARRAHGPQRRPRGTKAKIKENKGKKKEKNAFLCPLVLLKWNVTLVW